MREQFVAKFNEVMSKSIWRSGKRHHMRPDGFIEEVEFPETPEQRHARVHAFFLESLRERNARPLKDGTCSFCAHQISEPEIMIAASEMKICAQCIKRLQGSSDTESWKPVEPDSQCAICCIGGRIP